MKTLFVSALLMSACGSTTNPDACCTDAADCATKGLPDGSMCTGGLICRGNTCIAEDCTSSADCEAGAPFCPSSGLCAATCDVDAECPGFGGDDKDKFCESGTCIECRDATDCTDPARGICDAHACRGCAADTECASGACGADGVCVDAASLLYLDPTGFDSGTCTQSAPCKTLTFALTKASPSRYIVSMAGGQYVEAVNLDPAMTTATRFEIHGHGAGLVPPGSQDSSAFRVSSGFTGVTIRNLTVANQPNGMVFASPLELDDVTFSHYVHVVADAGLTATNVILAEGDGIEVRGQLTADRFSLTSSTPTMFTGLFIDPGAAVNVTNLVVTGAAYQCVTLSNLSTGSISFATIADCGTMLTSVEGGPAAVKCNGSDIALKASIIWSPNPTYAPVDSCNFSQMIIGPTAVTGASFADPQFVDLAGHDLQLKATSPAIDTVESGPANDVSGTLRPQGARFDLCGYEYKP